MSVDSLAPGSLERLLDSVGILVCGLDPHGQIVHSNRSCEQLTGIERNSLRGQNWLEIFAQSERHDGIRKLWHEAAGGGLAGPFEALCRNERRIQWRFTLWQVEHPAGDGVCAYGFDVTREREEVARVRAAERTLAVAQLGAGLAHEIRNPLNSAKLQLDLTERQLATSRIDRAAESVKRASTEIMRASDMLSDFLTFARPPKVDLAPVDLRAVVVAAKERVVADRGHGPAIDVESGAAPIIDADADLIGTAVEQLLTNALDAVSEDGADGRVFVRVRVEGNVACVDVEDDGPGLPAPETPVFDAFFTTKPGSTGLGLAIVQRAAFDHGGSVSYSRENDRTTFTLSLPVVFPVSPPA